MIRLWIYGPSLTKGGPDKKAREEYIKRLSRSVTVRFKPSASAPEDAIRFCPQGDPVDSPGLASLLSQKLQGSSELHLAFGPECPQTAASRLQLTSVALSAETESVLLLEQVYRAFKILSGEPYHK